MSYIFSAEQIWADIEYRGKSVSKEFVKLTDYKELEADRLTMCESAEKLIKANVMLKALMEDDKNKNKELEAGQSDLTLAYMTGQASNVKAKRLVWEDGEDSFIQCENAVFLYVEEDGFLGINSWQGDELYRKKLTSIDEAKQAAQKWYDNYVSEFIKENCT